MAFTDNCDLYAAVHEDGINLVARHVMRQRPSLFNYASQYVIDHPEVACSPVDHTIDVTNHRNPLFKLLGPIPLFGVDAPPVGLNFSAQLVEAKIDFHPGNVINLPAELNPPLPAQHMALKLRVCGGLDCPSQDFINQIKPDPPDNTQGKDEGRQPQAPIVPASRKLLCFCLDAYVVAHVDLESVFGKPGLVGKVDGVDIVDIKPDNLEETINCYLRTTLELLLKEKLAIPLEKLALSFPVFGLGSITLTPTSNPPIPHNPAIEEDQIKAFVTIT